MGRELGGDAGARAFGSGGRLLGERGRTCEGILCAGGR